MRIADATPLARRRARNASERIKVKAAERFKATDDEPQWRAIRNQLESDLAYVARELLRVESDLSLPGITRDAAEQRLARFDALLWVPVTREVVK